MTTSTLGARAPRACAWLLLASCGTAPAGPVPPVPSAAAVPFLQQRAAPPAGVPASIEGTLTAGFGFAACPVAGMECSGGHCRSVPLVQATGSAVTLPEVAWLCVDGFAKGTLLEVGVVSPTGKRQRRRVVFGGSVEKYAFGPELEGPGTHTLEVLNGAARFTAELEVSLPKEKTVLVEPRPSAPGSPLALGVAGYPPRSRLAAHVYRAPTPDAERYAYVGTLELDTSAHGVGWIDIPSHAADPLGQYQVNILPGEASTNFELEAR